MDGLIPKTKRKVHKIKIKKKKSHFNVKDYIEINNNFYK